VHRTPVHAIWIGALLAFLSTLYTPAFLTLAAGCAVFLYISYAMPVAAGMLAEGRRWTRKGPFTLGVLSRPLAALTVLGTVVLLVIGIQPPNDGLVTYIVGLLALMAVLWFGIARRRFPGPPVGDALTRRRAEIAAAQEAVPVV
jgi:amino acid transporter